MTSETPRYLRFARALALTAALGAGGCDQTAFCDRECCSRSMDAGNDSGIVEAPASCPPLHRCCGVPGPLSPPDLPV